MSSSGKVLTGIFLLLFFVLGLSLAKLVYNFPFVKFDGTINVVDLGHLLVTIAIGVAIPLLFKKLIDDSRHIKSFLAEEVQELVSILKEIRELISVLHSNGKVTPKDKKEIVYIIHRADLQISSLTEQLEVSFNHKSSGIVAAIKEEYFGYDDFLTGGKLMTKKFDRIDDTFYRTHNTKFSHLITHLKMTIHKIHKF